MHETSDLAGLDEFGDALLEPPAQNDFTINLKLEFLIHTTSQRVAVDPRNLAEMRPFLQTVDRASG
jgi:hypothetical protein